MGKSGISRISFFNGAQSSVTLGVDITTLLQCEMLLSLKPAGLLSHPPNPRVQRGVLLAAGRAGGKFARACLSPALPRYCRGCCEPSRQHPECAPRVLQTSESLHPARVRAQRNCESR